MKHLGSTIPGKSKHKQKPGKTATTRKSPGQICVSPAGKTAKQHKRGRSHNQKHPHQKHRIALDTEGKPNVSSKSALRNKLASLWPEKGEKLYTCEKQQQTCEVLCQAVHYGSHLRVLSDVLFLLSRRLINFGSSCSCQKSLGVHSAEGYRNPRTSHSYVVRPMWFSELLAAVPSQRGQHCGPRQILRQGQAAGTNLSDLT